MQKKVFMGIDGGGTYTRVAITNELVWLGTGGFEKTYAKRMELFANFAKNITDAALSESNLAKKICEQAAIEITTGIKIVGECFESDMIKVALTGSVANSQYIKEQIGKCLLNAKISLLF